jgi:hypothetical protein
MADHTVGTFCGDLAAGRAWGLAARCGFTSAFAGRCGVSSPPCGQPHGLKIRVSGVRFPLWPLHSVSPPHPLWGDFLPRSPP